MEAKEKRKKKSKQILFRLLLVSPHKNICKLAQNAQNKNAFAYLAPWLTSKEGYELGALIMPNHVLIIPNHA